MGGWDTFSEKGKALMTQALAAHAKRQARIEAAQYKSKVLHKTRQAAHPELNEGQLAVMAEYLPLEAAKLSQKPTPAAVRDWLRSPLSNLFTNGHLVDFISEPHLSGWERRMDGTRHSLENKEAAKTFRENMLKGAKDAVPARLLGWYTRVYDQTAKAGSIAVVAETGGEVQYFDLNYLGYFFSKFGQVKPYLSIKNSGLYLRSGTRWVGLIAGVRAGHVKDWQPSAAQIEKEIALHEQANTADSTKFSRSKAQDQDYLDAASRGDLGAAQRMVNEAARLAGYDSSTDYRMQHQAPNRVDDVNAADLRQSGLVPADYWTHPQRYLSDPARENGACGNHRFIQAYGCPC